MTNWEELKINSNFSISKTRPYKIKNNKTEKEIKIINNKTTGYEMINLENKKYYFHFVIACQFLGMPPNDNVEVDHKDGNRKNNIPENLEWVSHSLNCARRKSRKGLKYEFIPYEEAPNDIVEFQAYKGHELIKNYYYSFSKNKVYFDNLLNLKVLNVIKRYKSEIVIVKGCKKLLFVNLEKLMNDYMEAKNKNLIK